MTDVDLLEREQTARDGGDESLLLYEAAAPVEESEKAAIISRAAARGIEQPEGTELLQIIRPGVGRGRGHRYYGPEVLEADAPNWSGARMFLNHETDAEREARANLPRKVEHLGGRIVESWWDGDVSPSSDGRFEQGGTYGFVRPVKLIRELHDTDPELVEASIAAFATRVKPGRHNGQACTIVEGIREKPRSVDWIAGDGGAGGRVLTEATADEEEAVLESMTDDELKAYLTENRPELAALLEAATPSKKDDEEDQVDITPEMLREALQTDEGKALLQEVASEFVTEPEGYVKTDEVNRLVESAISEKTDLIRLETAADFQRTIELRDMKDTVVTLVEAAKLHPKLAAQITSKYALVEGEPTPALDIAPDLDDSHNVTKTATAKLVEAVEEDIESARSLMTDLGARTRVRGQGARSTTSSRTKLQENEDAGDDTDDKGNKGEQQERTPRKPKSTGSALTDSLLESAGFPSDTLTDIWATA